MRETDRQGSMTSKGSEEVNADSDDDQRLVIDLDASQGSQQVNDDSKSKDSKTEDSLDSSLKMKIKRTKNSGTRAEAKHEIVRDAGSPARSGRSTPRQRRKVNGTATPVTTPSETSEDPYEFSDKPIVDKKEEPKLTGTTRSRKEKDSASSEDRRTSEDKRTSDVCKKTEECKESGKCDVGVETCHQNVGTEPECLGPCEPGTNVSLEGIVWQESLSGFLVVNVTWRGRSYVGTLMDQAQHTWAPPNRSTDSPTAELEPRTPRGRGRRGRLGTSDAWDQRKLRKNRRNGRTSCPSSPRNTERRRRPTDLDVEEVKAKKARMSSSSTPAEECSSPTPEPVSERIACPEENCCKKYSDLNALAYHRAHAHYKTTDDSPSTPAHSPQPKGKRDKSKKSKNAGKKDKSDNNKDKQTIETTDNDTNSSSTSDSVSSASLVIASTTITTTGSNTSRTNCSSVTTLTTSRPSVTVSPSISKPSSCTVAQSVAPMVAPTVAPTGTVAPTLRPVTAVSTVCSMVTTSSKTPPKTQPVAPLVVARDPVDENVKPIQASKATVISAAKPIHSTDAKDKKKKRKSKDGCSPLKDGAEQSIPSQHSPQLMTSRAGPKEVHAKLQGGTISIGPANTPVPSLPGDGNVSSPAAYSDISDAEDESKQKNSSNAQPKQEMFTVFPPYSLNQYYGLPTAAPIRPDGKASPSPAATHRPQQPVTSQGSSSTPLVSPVVSPVVQPAKTEPTKVVKNEHQTEPGGASRENHLHRLAYAHVNERPLDSTKHEQLLRTEPSYEEYIKFYLSEKRDREKLLNSDKKKSPSPSTTTDRKTPVKPLMRPVEPPRPTVGVKPMQQQTDTKRPVASAAPMPSASAPSPDLAKKAKLEGDDKAGASRVPFGAAFPIHAANPATFDPHVYPMLGISSYLPQSSFARLPSSDSSVSPRQDGKPALTPGDKKEVPGSRPAGQGSPPPQRHLHTHHHTHVVQPGYPILTDYAAYVASQALAAPHSSQYIAPRPPKH